MEEGGLGDWVTWGLGVLGSWGLGARLVLKIHQYINSAMLDRYSMRG